MKLGNKLWEHTIFNNRLQPVLIGLGTSQSIPTAQSINRFRVDYSYGGTNNNGNVQQQTISVPDTSGNYVAQMAQFYTYDELNRLKSAQENGAASWKQTYSYDRYGNRTFDANNTTYPAPLQNPGINSTNDNRINANQGYGYDFAGNLLSAPNQTFTYDAENRMASYNGGNPISGGGTFSYDGDGRMVKKVASSGTTIYVYNASGQMVAEYTDNPPQTNGGVSYLTNDTLGTPRFITDSNGGVKARHDYLPFGEEVMAGVGGRTEPQKYVADNVRQKFTQKERDVETGLDYFGARYYASVQGRFTGVDAGPFTPADPQNFNRYAYVQNNPLKFRDPSGNKIELAGDQAQGFIDYLEKNTSLKLKYKTNNGAITITGSSKDKSFTGKVNEELAAVVKKVAGASGTAKFDVSSSIINGNDKGEAVFIDDNATAFSSSSIDSRGNRNIRAGNINLTSINSVAGQDADFARALVGHTLIEGLDMRAVGANFDLGEKGDPSAHQTGLDVERRILGQKDKRYQPPTSNPNPTTSDPISFVYTTVQYDVIIKNDGSATINKVSPPTIQRPK